jgi:hypothetical protein
MRVLLLAAAFFGLAGCAQIPPVAVDKPAQREPIKSQAQATKSIYVSNVTTKMLGRKIGQATSGLICINGEEMTWLDSQFAINLMRERISDTLRNNGYSVHAGLIQSSAEKDADVLIGVGIEDMKANVCFSVQGQKGEASVKLKFEILDNKTRQSINLLASGSSKLTEFDKTGTSQLLADAAAMATVNLLAEEMFFNATRK